MRCVALCISFSTSASTPIGVYSLSLHDALPISYDAHLDRGGRGVVLGSSVVFAAQGGLRGRRGRHRHRRPADLDRKSTRLNTSHVASSYAAFCLKKTIPCCSLVQREC